MTRHYAESNIKIILTTYLLIDSDVRQWTHTLVIPLHYLRAKSNNWTRGQFECNVTWFCFCFDFVRSHARCGCCLMACRTGWVQGSFKGQGGGKISDVGKQGVEGLEKLDNFHGRLMCYLPYAYCYYYPQLFYSITSL